jgi:chaperonin cofactor prefoldin
MYPPTAMYQAVSSGRVMKVEDDRVDALEKKVSELESQLGKLQEEFLAFKRQFE